MNDLAMFFAELESQETFTDEEIEKAHRDFMNAKISRICDGAMYVHSILYRVFEK